MTCLCSTTIYQTNIYMYTYILIVFLHQWINSWTYNSRKTKIVMLSGTATCSTPVLTSITLLCVQTTPSSPSTTSPICYTHILNINGSNGAPIGGNGGKSCRHFSFFLYCFFGFLWALNYSKMANSGPRTYSNIF